MTLEQSGTCTLPADPRGMTRPASPTIYFDLVDASNTTDFTLTAPNGTTEVFSSYRDEGPLDLKDDGIHELLTNPRGDETVAFEFALKPEE